MTGLYFLCGVVAVGLLRLPAGRPLQRREPVMPTVQVWLQLAVYLALLLGARLAVGTWLAAVAEGRLPRWLAPLVGSSAPCIARAGVDRCREHGWQRYAVALLAFNVIGVARRVCAAAPAGRAAAQPAGHGRGQRRLVVQHRRELRHQHQLAGLRRRVDHELPDADAGAGGAELLLGRHRHRRRLRADPRLRRALERQPSATSGSTSPARRSTCCCRCRFVFALFLVGQGVIQNFDAYKDVTTLEVNAYSSRRTVPTASR